MNNMHIPGTERRRICLGTTNYALTSWPPIGNLTETHTIGRCPVMYGKESSMHRLFIAAAICLCAATSYAAETAPAAVHETLTTNSGMQYTSLGDGTGATPGPTDTVGVNYRGTLMNGREFDSSYRSGRPAEFRLNGVIKCWTEGLQLMKVGGRARLECPSSLAYGDDGIPGVVPRFAPLTFEVELLYIK